MSFVYHGIFIGYAISTDEIKQKFLQGSRDQNQLQIKGQLEPPRMLMR